MRQGRTCCRCVPARQFGCAVFSAGIEVPRCTSGALPDGFVRMECKRMHAGGGPVSPSVHAQKHCFCQSAAAVLCHKTAHQSACAIINCSESMTPSAPPAGGAPCSPIKTIAVFCGFSAGRRPEYMQAARDLGAEMARRNVGLVYGGGGRLPVCCPSLPSSQAILFVSPRVARGARREGARAQVAAA